MYDPIRILFWLPGFTTILLLITGFLIRRTKHSVSYLKAQKKTILIAILTPPKIAVVMDSLRPFIAYIKKYASFEFEIIDFIDNATQEKAARLCNSIQERKVDLVLSLGNFLTEIMYESIRHAQNKIPFISVGSAIGYSEIPLEAMQMHTPMTAVSTQLDWPAKITLLKKILPHIKNVLVIACSLDDISHGSLREKNTITAALRKYQINWHMHHAPHIKTTTDLTPQIMENIDIILLSRGSGVLKYTSRIAMEAKSFNVPVLSPDMNNEDIFLGISECPERAIGIQSAKYAIEILEDGVPASQLPLKEIKDREKVIIYPHNSSPMLATTAIGNLLTQSNIVSLCLKQQEKSSD